MTPIVVMKRELEDGGERRGTDGALRTIGREREKKEAYGKVTEGTNRNVE